MIMAKLCISYIVFFLLFYLSHEVKYPVILIPGLGGSQMEAKLENKPSAVHFLCERKTTEFFLLWLNLESLIPLAIDCLLDNLRLVYNNYTRTTSNSPGVTIRIPNFGNCSTVEWIDSIQLAGSYFNYIVDTLVDLGYQRNRMIRGAPYDFRKGPNEQEQYFKNLKNLIEQTYEINGQQKVILIVHSLGALMASVMLRNQSQSWKNKYIKLMISLAGAWGGSVKAVKAFAVGDNFGLFYLPHRLFQEAEMTSPSLAWLLPSPYSWKPDEILVQTATKNYSLRNLKEFFSDIGYAIGWEMCKDAWPYVRNDKPLGIEIHCLYGYGVPTIEQLLYERDTFPDGSPTLLMGDGDGTVNIRSLNACTHWAGFQAQKIFEVGFPATDHMYILRSTNTIEYIKQLINQLD